MKESKVPGGIQTHNNFNHSVNDTSIYMVLGQQNIFGEGNKEESKQYLIIPLHEINLFHRHLYI